MTDSTNNEATTDQPAASKKPLPAYTYREGEDGKSFRTRVGVVWLHKNGKGCNLDLDATPLNGKVVIFFQPLANE